jgi:hypothetical protein
MSSSEVSNEILGRESAAKKRGPAPHAVDPRDKTIATQARELARWKHRAERAEALVELQKNVAALLGTPFENEKS